MRYGLYDARGYDFPVEKRYAELWRAGIAPSPDCNYAFCPESAGTAPRALQALGLLGVTYLLQNRRDEPLLRRAPAGLRRARTRASTATRRRCRARSSSTASRWSTAATRRAPRSTAAGLPRARRWR